MNPRTVLRVDAVLYTGLAALLLSATWARPWEALDLPRPEPELWAQLFGVVLLAFAWLLWTAPRDAMLMRAVAGASAAANAAGALVVLVWLIVGDLDVGSLGTTLLGITAVLLALFAALEARIAAYRARIISLDRRT